MRSVIKIIALVAAVLLIAYLLMWVYVITHAIFTYQCKIYDGRGFDAEQHRICDNYNTGGLIKVLTN